MALQGLVGVFTQPGRYGVIPAKQSTHHAREHGPSAAVPAKQASMSSGLPNFSRDRIMISQRRKDGHETYISTCHRMGR